MKKQIVDDGLDFESGSDERIKCINSPQQYERHLINTYANEN